MNVRSRRPAGPTRTAERISQPAFRPAGGSEGACRRGRVPTAEGIGREDAVEELSHGLGSHCACGAGRGQRRGWCAQGRASRPRSPCGGSGPTRSRRPVSWCRHWRWARTVPARVQRYRSRPDRSYTKPAAFAQPPRLRAHASALAESGPGRRSES